MNRQIQALCNIDQCFANKDANGYKHKILDSQSIEFYRDFRLGRLARKDSSSGFQSLLIRGKDYNPMPIGSSLSRVMTAFDAYLIIKTLESISLNVPLLLESSHNCTIDQSAIQHRPDQPVVMIRGYLVYCLDRLIRYIIPAFYDFPMPSNQALYLAHSLFKHLISEYIDLPKSALSLDSSVLVNPDYQMSIINTLLSTLDIETISAYLITPINPQPLPNTQSINHSQTGTMPQSQLSHDPHQSPINQSIPINQEV